MEKTDSLYDKEESIKFYNERYLEEGYIRTWPIRRKTRLVEALLAQNLPETGKMLDFGCGSGVLTQVLKETFPQWEVWGCDISETGVNDARKNYPGCSFFVMEKEQPPLDGFDFVFSHHVLEHVFDLKISLAELSSWCKPQARMLHVLPCGNKGSWEYEVTVLMKDGIDPQREGRFYFEDVGHLRRLTTEQMENQLKEFGFHLVKPLYFGQKWGGMEYLCEDTAETVHDFCHPSRLANPADLSKLQALTADFLAYNEAFGRVFVGREFFRGFIRKGLRTFHLKQVAQGVKGLWTFGAYEKKKAELEAKSDHEWKTQKENPGASEMLLGFSRS